MSNTTNHTTKIVKICKNLDAFEKLLFSRMTQSLFSPYLFVWGQILAHLQPPFMRRVGAVVLVCVLVVLYKVISGLPHFFPLNEVIYFSWKKILSSYCVIEYIPYIRLFDIITKMAIYLTKIIAIQSFSQSLPNFSSILGWEFVRN